MKAIIGFILIVIGIIVSFYGYYLGWALATGCPPSIIPGLYKYLPAFLIYVGFLLFCSGIISIGIAIWKNKQKNNSRFNNNKCSSDKRSVIREP